MKVYFTPGPSQLHHTYDFHLRKAVKDQIGSISHRGQAFQGLYQATEKALRELLQIPDDFKILFTSSATDIWERIIQNLVVKHSHHFVNGAFSERFHKFALDLGKSSTVAKATEGEEFSSFEIPVSTEVICITQNETSTGYAFDPQVLKSIRQSNPDQLIALDVVSSAAAVPIDFSSIDMSYFSVQKCFGLPAGLGVWIINERAIERAKKLQVDGHQQGTYRSLPSMLKYAAKNQTPETPNVLNIYLLGKIAEEMINRGAHIIRNETIYKSTLLYQALKDHQLIEAAIANKVNQSKTVIVADCGSHQGSILNHFDKLGFVLGKGYGQSAADQIRIANFPAHSKEHIEMLCDELKKLN